MKKSNACAILYFSLTLWANVSQAADWFFGDTVTVADKEGFALAPVDTTYEALVDLFEMGVKAIDPEAWRGRFKRGKNYDLDIPLKPGKRPKPVNIRVTRLENGYGVQKIDLEVSVNYDEPVVVKFRASPLGTRTNIRVLVKAETPGVVDIVSKALETIVTRPYTWGFDLFVEAGNAMEALQEAGQKKKKAKDYVKSFIAFWAAFAEFKARNPDISLRDIVTDRGKEIVRSVFLRSPYGHTLPALDIILQTFVRYRTMLAQQGLEIDGDDFSFYRRQSKLTIHAKGISLAFVTKKNSQRQVVLGATATMGDYVLPEFDIVLSEKRAGEEGTHILTQIDVNEAQLIQHFIKDPQKAFACLEHIILLSQKLSQVRPASDDNFPAKIAFDFWSDLAHKISDETFDIESTGISTCSSGLMSLFFTRRAEMLKLTSIFSGLMD
jgi:hypothetical protein